MKVFLLLALLFFVNSNSLGENLMFLKTIDVIGLTVEQENKENGLTKLTISGLAFHSSLAVEKITTVKNDKTSLTILVYLSTAKPHISGRFNYSINLTKEIEVVKFGEDESVIWKRK